MKKNIISIISIAICAIIVLIVFGGVAFINDKKRQIGTIIIWADEEEYDDIINSGNFFCRKVHPDTSRKLLAMLRRNITKE